MNNHAPELLRAAEERLAAVLAQPEAPPFFAALDGGALRAAVELGVAFVRSRFDRADGLVRLLRLHPALGTALVCNAVERIGEAGSNAFYPRLAELLGCDLAAPERTDIVDAFRAAQRRLGLPTIGRQAGHLRDDRIIEYLLRYGVPPARLPVVQDALERVLHGRAPPDPEDTVACRRLLDRAARRIQNQPRLLQVLAVDDTGFYARYCCAAALGSAALRAPKATAPTPIAMLTEDRLRIALPACIGKLELRWPDGSAALEARDRECFAEIPLSAEVIEWTWRGDSCAAEGVIDLLPREAGAILVFDAEDGELAATILDPNAGADLPCGQYRLVSRADLSTVEDVGWPLAPGFEALDVDLDQLDLVVYCGGRTTVLRAIRRARLVADGPFLRNSAGAPVYAGAALRLRVDLPPDSSGPYTVSVAPYGDVLPVQANGTVDLSPILSAGAELVRIVATLAGTGGGRGLARLPLLVAEGASGAAAGRMAGPVPANLDAARASGADFSPSGWGVSSHATAEALVPFLPDERCTLPNGIELRIPRPGLRVWSVDVTGNRAALRVGQTVAFAAGAEGSVDLECDDPYAILLIHGEPRGRPFRHRQRHRLSAAGLRAAAGSGEAVYEILVDGHCRVVLRALSAESAHDPRPLFRDGRIGVTFSLAVAADAARVVALPATADAPIQVEADLSIALTETADLYCYEVLVPVGAVPPASLLLIDARIDGAWRRVRAPDGDVAVGMRGRVPPRAELLEPVLALIEHPVAEPLRGTLSWLTDAFSGTALSAWRSRSARPALAGALIPEPGAAPTGLRPAQVLCALPHILAEGYDWAESLPGTHPTRRHLAILRAVARSSDDDLDDWIVRAEAPTLSPALVRAVGPRFDIAAYASALCGPAQPDPFDLAGPGQWAWAVANWRASLLDLPLQYVADAAVEAACLACNPRSVVRGLLRGVGVDVIPDFQGMEGLPLPPPSPKKAEQIARTPGASRYAADPAAALPAFACYTALCLRGERERPWASGELVDRVRKNGWPALAALDIVLDQGRDALVHFLLAWEIVLRRTC